MPYTSYVDVPTFKLKTLLHPEIVQHVDTSFPGFILGTLVDWSVWLDGQLRKRYAVPFVVPVPLIVPRWICRLASPDVYRKRFLDPQSDPLLDHFMTDRTAAEGEVAKAADCVTGLWDLPLLDTGTASAVTQGLPLMSADQDPYSWTDRQAIANGRRFF